MILRAAIGGAVAQRRQVGNQSHEPEQQRNRGIGGDREHVPHQRAAELRPHPHGVGIREQPVSQPGPAHVDQRKHAGGRHRKQRHGLGEAVDRVAPRLPQQQQDGGDQRAGVADADPPHKIDDGKSPADGNGDAPDPDAAHKQITNRVQHHHGQQESHAESDEPPARGRPREHDRADLVGDRGKGMPRLDDRSSAAGRRFAAFVHCLTRSSTDPSYFPTQDSDSASPPNTSSADACSSPPASRNCADCSSASIPGCSGR